MQGYVRVHPDERPDAVIWWFVREFPDGFVYARGGETDKARHARKAIRDCWGHATATHRRWLERPTHRLMPDGSLNEIDYGWGDRVSVSNH